ncbi:hypothetical protein [Metabacillus malikii]|uniref:Uncharacterized protein n=1 Tax=Metabacillus malikii TaxID=1504265 RepID=A0ABT9ZL81_9BACI|nr:hypothetical protein [Metabacillus malikii]MDQ0233024.1 hypothetical protein [Metabacillus malikii]
MNVERPSFLDSPYFYYDMDGSMCLRDEAPKEIQREFNKYRRTYREWYEQWDEGLRIKDEE